MRTCCLALLCCACLHAQSWTQLTPAVTPSSAQTPALTFDPVSGKSVLLAVNQTWLWDGAQWTRSTTSSSPPDGVMAFDEVRRQIVTYTPYAGTWTWNGTAWTSRPSARRPLGGIGMAWDPVSKRVIMFGPTNPGPETWAWDGTDWQKLSPSVMPPARLSPAMATDALHNQIVLYGGSLVSNGAQATDTWIWDGSNWIDKSPAYGPGRLSTPVMTYDSGSSRVLLYPGMWSWDGTTWRQAATTDSPTVGLSAALAYDPLRDRTYLFRVDPNTSTPPYTTWAFQWGNGCSIDAGPDPIRVPSAGGTFDIPVPMTPGCSWTATLPSRGVTLLTSSGTGPGAIRVTIAPNEFLGYSGMTITVAGHLFGILQDRPPCPSDGPLPAEISVGYYCSTTFTHTGTAGSQIALHAFAVLAYDTKDATVQLSGPLPATTVVPLSSTGVATLPATGTYQVTVDTTSLRYAYQLKALQQGAPCQLVGEPGMIGSGGGEISFSLPPGCPVRPLSTSDNWVHLSATSIVPGFQKVTYTADTNPGPSRSATIYAGDLRFSVSQEAGGCFNTSSLVTAPWSGWSGSMPLLFYPGTVPGCSPNWTTSSSANWVQPFPVSGTGSNTIQYTVYPNFNSFNRTATMTVAGMPVTVFQIGNSFTPAQRFVQMMYFSFLGRLPSLAELDYQVGAGLSREQLAFNLMNSSEFNSYARFVAGLYVGLLDRDAEYGGWLFQTNALRQSVSASRPHETLVAFFVSSEEFRLKYGQLDNRAFMRMLYNQVLLRQPTEAELDFQAGILGAGVTRMSMAYNFLNSTEFRIGTGPRLTAFLIYATLLRRDGTPSEIAAMRAAIAQAQSPTALRDLIIKPIVDGAEFASQLQ